MERMKYVNTYRGGGAFYSMYVCREGTRSNDFINMTSSRTLFAFSITAISVTISVPHMELLYQPLRGHEEHRLPENLRILS
jgi:hypothetical protein